MFSLEALACFFLFVVILAAFFSLQSNALNQASSTLQEYQIKLEVEETVLLADALYVNAFGKIDQNLEKKFSDSQTARRLTLTNSLVGVSLSSNEVKPNEHYR